MNIIETVTEFNSFMNEAEGCDWFIVPIYSNGNKPAPVDTISCIYIYTIYKDQEYLLSFNHTEGLNLPIEVIDQFPKNNKIFVYNLKRFLSKTNHKNLIDIDLIEYFQRNKSIDDEFDTMAHEHFTRSLERFNNLNNIIPIVKHIERCQAITSKFLEIHDGYVHDDAFDKYNNLIIPNLYNIEKSGLYTNFHQFANKFPNQPSYEGYVFSEYNMYTSTGRPSNRFGGINFAALNKDNGQRSPFVSRFGEEGFMVQFDYDAYHIRLLGALIDYDLPTDYSAHKYLGQYYFDKQDLSEAEISETKQINFRQLYGGIGQDYLTIPFFAQVDEYTKLLYSQFKQNGYIETPLFGRKLHRNFFKEINAAKLLNYLLQAYETERNMAVLQNLFGQISSYSSKLILYTYDSFLWDFNKKDGGSFIKEIKDLLEQNGKFPIKMQIGPDYFNMINVEKQI